MPPKGYRKNIFPPIPDLCHCIDNCGTIVYDGKQYVKGHDLKGRKSNFKGIKFSEEKREKFALKCAKTFLLKPDGSKEIYPFIPTLCYCGKCNEIIFGGANWIRGHNSKINNSMSGKQSWCKGLTKETDIRVAKISKDVSVFMKEHNPMKGKFNRLHHLYGTKSKPETIQKLKDSHKGKFGELSSAWQGGKSFEEYPEEFNKNLKNLILINDNYTCQLCNKTQNQQFKEINKTLHVHHIDYNKKNNKVYNLISLCVACHMKTNYNRKYYEQYFVLFMNERII